MRMYTAHIEPLTPAPDGAAVLLREGFNWAAFLFGVLWGLWHRLWWVSLLLLAIEAGVAVIAWFLSDPLLILALQLAVAIFVGASANDWRRWTLRRRGWVEAAVIAAPDRDAAEHRFLTQYLDHQHAAPSRLAAATMTTGAGQ